MIVIVGRLQYDQALVRKIRDDGPRRFLFKLSNLILHFQKSFVLDFSAPVLSYHLSLIREIKLLLIFDDVPGAINENRETVNRHGFATRVSILRDRWVQRILGIDIESSFKLHCFLLKLLCAKYLVGHQNIIDFEKILRC